MEPGVSPLLRQHGGPGEMNRGEEEREGTDRHLCALELLVRLDNPHRLNSLVAASNPPHRPTLFGLIGRSVQVKPEEAKRSNDVLPEPGRALANPARENEVRARAEAGRLLVEELEEIEGDELEEPVEVDCGEGGRVGAGARIRSGAGASKWSSGTEKGERRTVIGELGPLSLVVGAVDRALHPTGDDSKVSRAGERFQAALSGRVAARRVSSDRRQQTKGRRRRQADDNALVERHLSLRDEQVTFFLLERIARAVLRVMEDQRRVEVAAPRPADEPLERGQSHRGVLALAFRDEADGAARAEVGDDGGD
jgi:hypothetical protein